MARLINQTGEFRISGTESGLDADIQLEAVENTEEIFETENPGRDEKRETEKEVSDNIISLVKNNAEIFGESSTDLEAVENLFYFLTAEIVVRDATAKRLKPRNLNEVAVQISADGFDDMEFLFAKQLSKQARENRQHFLGMTKEEEPTRRHEVNVKDFAVLLRAEPINVPGWENGTPETLAERFAQRFSDEDENAWFIEWLSILYSKKLIPKEYS